jgi:pentose-5-phosphate-3-epimerase
MQSIPTLLTTTRSEFIDQMDTYQRYFSRIQLDIADSTLAPNTTVQISEMISLWKEGHVTVYPHVEFDFHLMVKDFESRLQDIQKLQKIGMQVNTVLINANCSPHISELAEIYDFSIGLDVFPGVQISDITQKYDLSAIPAIQIMTVNPGFQGSPFLPEMLEKIEQLRLQEYKGDILIDGGVNDESLSLILAKLHKPNFLCIGSYFTKAGPLLEERITAMKILPES